MEEIKVGLLGHNFFSENMGCRALAYSMFEIIQSVLKDSSVCYYVMLPERELKYAATAMESTYRIIYVGCSYRHMKSLLHISGVIGACDIVFDLSEGDSFSDIYGVKRFITNAMLKQISIFRRKPLILCPQTVGPFERKILRFWAVMIMKQAKAVFARDRLSIEYMRSLCDVKMDVTADVAFNLPYSIQEIGSEKINVGINLSALLWNGGYTGGNQFCLQVNYRKYCYKVIEYLLSENKYNIYLIPHVITEDYDNVENDKKICDEMQHQYHELHLLKKCDTPVEIKSFIAGMDIFMGARMHATIAAISSGVAVIPFSYSRKFEGLYENISYEYVVSGTRLTTDEALLKTKNWINEYHILEKAARKSSSEAKASLAEFALKIKKLLQQELREDRYD